MSLLAAERDKKLRAASLTGAVVAAIAASACCLVPAVLAIFGVSGAGFALALGPYRPLLLGVTAVLVAVGFYLTYRKPKIAGTPTSDTDACGCAAPRASRIGKLMLWSATTMAIVFAIYPYVAVANSDNIAAHDARGTVGTAIGLHVGGMTCGSCASHIDEALMRVDGVIRSEVDYDRATATVIYDPAGSSPAVLVRAIEAAGYSAQVQATP